MAAGFGSTASEEPFDADHHSSFLPADDEVSARVREALLADSRTSRLASSLDVEAAGGVITVRGTVADIEDGELIEEVASGVTGVSEVRDETDVPGL
jgi:osmotically-inducible protein OsmY